MISAPPKSMTPKFAKLVELVQEHAHYLQNLNTSQEQIDFLDIMAKGDDVFASSKDLRHALALLLPAPPPTGLTEEARLAVSLHFISPNVECAIKIGEAVAQIYLLRAVSSLIQEQFGITLKQYLLAVSLIKFLRDKAKLSNTPLDHVDSLRPKNTDLLLGTEGLAYPLAALRTLLEEKGSGVILDPIKALLQKLQSGNEAQLEPKMKKVKKAFTVQFQAQTKRASSKIDRQQSKAEEKSRRKTHMKHHLSHRQ
jgi:hypothetical protein